jgi:peptidoglycan hydrolase-like protein with peptidoglycan-binding domain
MKMPKNEQDEWLKKLGVAYPAVSKGDGDSSDDSAPFHPRSTLPGKGGGSGSGAKDSQYAGASGQDEQYGGDDSKDGGRGSVSALNMTASVGRGGRNQPDDVQAVQEALNLQNQAGLEVDGKCGPKTIAAISAYQRKIGFHRPDGLIEPGKRTARSLAGSPSAGSVGPEVPSRPTAADTTEPPANLPSQSGNNGNADPLLPVVSETAENATAPTSGEIAQEVGPHVADVAAGVLEVLGVIGVISETSALAAVAPLIEVILVGYGIVDAFQTGEKIMYAQGVCYGIMYQVVGHSNTAYPRPTGTFQVSDLEWNSRRQAWRAGLREGRGRGQERNFANTVNAAIRGMREQGNNQAEGLILNVLWHKIAARSDSTRLLAGTPLNWPSPGPQR